MKVVELKPARILFLILVLSGVSLLRAGQSYYVSPQGSDSNNGSISAPWLTLSYAVDRRSGIAPGDTIFMRGGTHFMNEVFVDRNKDRGGLPGKYLTIKAFPGEAPVLEYSSRRLIVWADYVRVEGLTFMMPWRCDAFGAGLQIINNRFLGPQPKFGAIETGGSDILVEGNYIEYDDNGGNTQDHGIYVHKGERITVRNNTIIGAQGYGIHLFDEQKSGDPAVWAANPFVIKDYIIEGNRVFGSKSRSGMIIAKGRGGSFITLQNIIVRDNVFAGNAAFGLFIREGDGISVFNNTSAFNGLNPIYIPGPSAAGVDPAKNISIVNNILVAGSEPDHIYNISPGGNITANNNLYNSAPRVTGVADARAIVGNPGFVNPDLRDYSLQPTSPAIDAGIDLGLPFVGVAPDVGAIEFDPNATAVEDDESLPEGFTLRQNYPNPFNPETNIVYEIQTNSDVTINVYDLLGRSVRTLVDGRRAAGSHTIKWDGRTGAGAPVASGVYFYRMEVRPTGTLSSSIQTRRMILLR